MPIYITQGRYTRDAIKGMIIKPEDRADAVSRLLSKVGGKLIGYYLTFGEYDFLSIAEMPNDTQMAAVLLAAGSGGGVTDLRTTVAMTSVEAKGAFAAASDLAPGFKSRRRDLNKRIMRRGNKQKLHGVIIGLNNKNFREDSCSNSCVGRALLLPVLLASLALPASAQNYPNRAVKLIVPFGAGGPADVYARVLAQHLSDETKQSFVVEDRPGAGAIIGTDAVAKSTPDGYTLLVMSNTHTTNELLLANKPYQLMRDFVPVATINYSDLLMVVHPSVPAKTVAEFIALAKKDPGKLNYASSGPGTPYHMAGELFKAMSDTDIVHVPHKASGDMRNSVLSGNVQMMFDAVTVMSELAKGGQVRALAHHRRQAQSAHARPADRRRDRSRL